MICRSEGSLQHRGTEARFVEARPVPLGGTAGASDDGAYISDLKRHARPYHLMHPVFAPPSGTLFTRSVWNRFRYQMFPPQATLSSTRSAKPLPRTMFRWTVLPAPPTV